METKVKFRADVREYVQRRISTPFDSLSQVQQAKEMTRFYIDKIMRVIAPGLVPEDEDDLEEGIVDGKDDCGVDFISRTEGRVLIVQSKYRKADSHEDPEHLSHFCDVLSRLSNPKQKMHNRLREAVHEIDWETDYFDLHYLTLAKVGDNVRLRAERGITDFPAIKGIEDRVELSFYDESELNIRLREAISAGELIEQSVPVQFRVADDSPVWLSFHNNKGRLTYVGLVAGTQFAELYRQYKYRLFAMNIRDYIGDTNTNRGIINTASSRPDEFLFYNNGVSAVATEIEEDSDNGILRCRRFSIINGAQTVRSLAKAHVKTSAEMKNVSVLLRISQFSLGKEHDFLEDVTRYNNTQNSVKISDFRSNDPVQRQLSLQFSELVRGGRKFWYKNKRSQDRSTNRIPIGMEEFAKTIHAFRFGPDDIFGGTAYLFDTDKTGGYVKVFGDGQEVWATVPGQEFRLLAGTWFLCEEVKTRWKTNKEKLLVDAENEIPKNALERRWVVYWAVGELLRIIYRLRGDELAPSLRRLWKPNWVGGNSIINRSVARLTDMACQALIQAYSRAASLPEFAHRNWFRSETTLKNIRSELETIPVYAGLENLPTLTLTVAEQD